VVGALLAAGTEAGGEHQAERHSRQEAALLVG
jgi:hypothetical protein